MLKNNILSVITALIILYLSLASAKTFDNVPLIKIPYFDKVVHFGMYFFLMSVMIAENRKKIKATSHLFLVALIPAFYGFLMEILQLTVTRTRSGDIIDFLADAAGILASLLIWLLIRQHLKESFR